VWVNPKSVTLYAGASNPTVYPWDAVIQEYSDTIGVGGGGDPGPGIELTSGRPNPFGASGTVMSFALAAGEAAHVEILDMRGRRVRRLWNGSGTGDLQSVAWDGRTDEGWIAPTGIYFARLEGEAGRSATTKLLRMP
jgi:hypothetical protein